MRGEEIRGGVVDEVSGSASAMLCVECLRQSGSSHGSHRPLAVVVIGGETRCFDHLTLNATVNRSPVTDAQVVAARNAIYQRQPSLTSKITKGSIRDALIAGERES